jgi:ERCC4-type nuclease
MILLTTAHNDKDLIPIFGSSAIPAAIPHGDFIFQGLWEAGKVISICGDRKKFPDLVQCIGDNRHLDQVRAAREAGFDFIFVALEAEWRDKDGQAQYKRSHWRDAGIETARVQAYLLQLQYYGGVSVFQTKNKQETVRLVLALEKMFQDPPEDHSSLLGFHTQPAPLVSLFGKPSYLRRVLKESLGVGWELSNRIEAKALERGDQLKDVTHWFRHDWEQVEGIGKGMSLAITEEMGWHIDRDRLKGEEDELQAG